MASEDVILMYPDYKKPFDLTTDASVFGLSPKTKALKDCKANYATNKRELLAIVWALRKLRIQKVIQIQRSRGGRHALMKQGLSFFIS